MKREKLINYYGMSNSQAEEVLRVLPSVKRALKHNDVWASVDHVARNGMSREISLYIIRKNKIYCLNYAFGKIFGDRMREGNRVFISGCGMDMLFEANYRLFMALFPQTAYQPYCRYKSL